MKNKKEFISKTLTFIANSVFINVFSKIFGVENTMVAVSIVVVALTLAAIDMKQNLVKRSLLVTTLMLIIAIGATVANINPMIGLLINFIIILGIIYQLFDHYKGSYYFPFLISYIFLLMSSPVTPDQLPKRAISVLFGCIYVFLVQLVLNRNRYTKTLATLEPTVINNLMTQITHLKNGTRDDTLYHKTNQMMPVLVKALYDNNTQGTNLSDLNKGYVRLILLLDNLNQVLFHMDLNEGAKHTQDIFLEHIQQLLQLMTEYLKCSKEEQSHIIKQMRDIIVSLNHTEQSDEVSAYILELKGLSAYLFSSSDTKEASAKKHTSLLKHTWRTYDFHSYNFKFALKAALSISLTIFLVEVCHITYGRWIIFPMIAIIQPYYDTTLQKAKHRIIGTLLGILLFTVLFTLIKDPTLRLNLTILTAYIGVFVTKYQYSTALVAISALGSSALRGGGIEILCYRSLFAVVGCILAMIINRFIFHYRQSNIKEDLQVEIARIKEELKTFGNIQEYEARIYHLLLDKKLMECKLRTL